MRDTYPDDADGIALRRVEEKGNDMSRAISDRSQKRVLRQHAVEILAVL